ncbi:MAG: MFS transporter [Pseudorhodoplanes sp.]|nr:MFS transporter [Pseudorhodoplanes sp.]
MAPHLRQIASLLLAVALLLAGNGLQFTLLPLRGAAEGMGTLALGLIGSAYYAGFVLGCVLGPFVILRAGHIRAFAAMVAVAAAVTLAYALAPTPAAWAAFRLVTGFCLAGFYLTIESWLNDGATNDNRGFIMSAYIIVNFGAITLGQMMVTLYPVEEAGSFMLAAILSSLAIVPVALTRSAQPAPITVVRFRPFALFEAAPVALVASFAIGIANGAFWGLGALSAAGSGLNVRDVAIFMSIAVAAGAVAQWPFGRLSDRIDRRLVLGSILIGAAVSGLAIFFFGHSVAALIVFGFLFGALALPAYSLAAAHGYDKTPRADLVATSATILLANGLGAAIGPLAAGALMSAQGPRALFLFTAIVQTLLAAYVFYRTRVQVSLLPPEKTDFDLATTAPVGAVVTAESPDPDSPDFAVPEDFARPAERPPAEP